jgi:hypothetical protein
MITPATVHEVQRWLARGTLSHREIARTLGISHATVDAIALGRRPNERIEERDQNRPPVRCRQCGGLVQPPCRLCRIRNWRDRRQRGDSRHSTEQRRRSA